MDEEKYIHVVFINCEQIIFLQNFKQKYVKYYRSKNQLPILWLQKKKKKKKKNKKKKMKKIFKKIIKIKPMKKHLTE